LQLIMFFGHVWLLLGEGGAMPRLIIISSLFDFCTGTRCRDRVADAQLLQLLDDIATHHIQRRYLRLARIVKADDVVAELRLHRRLGGFAFFQAGQGVGEFGTNARRSDQSSAPAVFGRARILGIFLRQVLEFGFLAQVGDQLFRLGFGFSPECGVRGIPARWDPPWPCRTFPGFRRRSTGWALT